jgi:hypothetical protein
MEKIDVHNFGTYFRSEREVDKFGKFLFQIIPFNDGTLRIWLKVDLDDVLTCFETTKNCYFSSN